MRKYVLGATLVAAGMVVHAMPAAADKLDDVLSRLDALEKRDAKLAAENAALKARLNKVETVKPATPAVAPAGAPARIVSTGLATPPPSREAPEIDKYGHGFLEHKKGNPLTFYTPGGEITGYGNIDVSVDGTTKSLNNVNTPAFPGVNTGGGPAAGGSVGPVGNFGWLPAISSNSSYLGVRGFQRLDTLPFNFVYQLEVGFDVSATPGLRQTNSQVSNVVNGSLFNRNTYIGIASPEWGAVKIGKTDAPYATSTGGFNPFAGQIGDYRVIMGNTGGDNRVEFGGRLDHSIWYESPTIAGFQWNLLFSPGQNRSLISDNIASGESDCTAGNDPTSGGNTPVTCSDGAFSNAVSTNLSYTNGPFYATAAYERRFKTNRQSDIAAIYGLNSFSPIVAANNCAAVSQFLSPGSQAQANFLAMCNADVADEDAFKVAALYTFKTKTTVGAIWETIHRYVPAFLSFQNERQKQDTWVFLTQEMTPNDSVSLGWAHAFRAPGDPGQHNTAGIFTTTTGMGGFLLPTDGAGNFAPNNNSADLISATYKHKFGSNLTWYTAAAVTINGPSAHYDLGAGGAHGLTTDCHDAFAASGGLASNPHCFAGTILAGASTGLQWRF